MRLARQGQPEQRGLERGGGMAYMEEGLLQEWLEALKDLNVHVKKMFGCHCLYCDGRPVGWMSGDAFIRGGGRAARAHIRVSQGQ